MVDIGPIQAANGMTPVTGLRLESVKLPGSVANNPPVDRVEISPIARLMSEISALPDIRAEKVVQVRAEIQAGTYITPEKLDIAIDRLLEDIQL